MLTLTRRAVAGLALAVATVAFAPAAWAMKEVAYTQEAFDAAQKDGKTVLVDVFADWCPVCRKQAGVLADLAKDPKFADVVLLKVDYDSQKDAVKRFAAPRQSTLVVYKDGMEKGRLIADTSANRIRQLVEAGL